MFEFFQNILNFSGQRLARYVCGYHKWADMFSLQTFMRVVLQCCRQTEASRSSFFT